MKKADFLFCFFVLPLFVLPYSTGLACLGGWRFLAITLSIFVLSLIFYRSHWVQRLGLSLNIRQLTLCILTFIVFLPLFYLLIHLALKDADCLILPYDEVAISTHYGDFLFPLGWIVERVFQALNEEMLLRAFLLGFLAKFLSNRLVLSIGSAFIFSVLHFVLYKYGLLLTPLTLTALTTLFFFSLAANALFFISGHIGYSFALHLAWNWWRFSGPIIQNNIVLNEAQTFNIIEGSTLIAITAALLSIVCVIALEAIAKNRL